MKTWRVLAAFGILVMVLIIAACSGDEDEKQIEPSIEPREVVISMVSNEPSGNTEEYVAELMAWYHAELMIYNEYLQLWAEDVSWSSGLQRVFIVCRQTWHIHTMNPPTFNTEHAFWWRTRQLSVVYSEENGDWLIFPHYQMEVKHTVENQMLTRYYLFGNDSRFMRIMAVETMEYYTERLAELVEQGVIDVADKNTFIENHMRMYSPSRWQVGFDWDGTRIWPEIMYIDYFWTAAPRTATAEQALLYLYGILGIDHNRMRQEEALFGNPWFSSFRIPLIYELDGNSLLVCIDADGIRYAKEFSIKRIEFLGAFGMADDTFFFPTDGSVTFRFEFAVKSSDELPLIAVMSLETMDYFMDRFEELIDQGVATIEDARLFRGVYSLQERYRLEEWGWDGLGEYLIRYPLLPYFEEFLWLSVLPAETHSKILALYQLLGIDENQVQQEAEIFGVK